MEVIPIGISTVDWRTYIDCVAKATGTSPTHHLDAYSMRPDTLGAFLASLVHGRDPRQILRCESGVLAHAFASFLIICDYEVLARSTTWDLAKLYYESGRREVVIIVSGTIKQWKDTALTACQPSRPTDERLIVNKCLLCLEKAGLGEVFGNYKKDALRDGTFILKEKQ